VEEIVVLLLDPSCIIPEFEPFDTTTEDDVIESGPDVLVADIVLFTPNPICREPCEITTLLEFTERVPEVSDVNNELLPRCKEP
jgi:hypothetical protein